MVQYIEYLCLAAMGIVFYQFYAYSVSLTGVEKQSSCQRLGTVFITLGVVSFAFRNPPLVIAGIILIMMGLRLLAHGLDRLNKKTFIDRYDAEK